MSTATKPQVDQHDEVIEPIYEWKRNHSTDWFSNYREPNPDVELPTAISSFFSRSVLLALIACFYLGPLETFLGQVNELLVLDAFFLPSFAAVVYVLRFHIWNRRKMKTKVWEIPACLLFLFVVLLVSDFRFCLFPLTAGLLALTYVVTGDLIASECIRRKALALPMLPGYFFRGVFARRFDGQLSEERRTTALNRSFWKYNEECEELQRLPKHSLEARNIYIRNVNLARCFDALHLATREHARLYAFVLFGSIAVGFAVMVIAAKRGINYWEPQIYLAVAGFILLSVASTICSYDTKSSYQRSVDKDFANRSWLAASPANSWRAAFLLAFTTIVVCRTANYFPVLPVHRVEIASAYLETKGLPSSPEHATAFLNALPENWVIASLDCVRRSSITHALPHLSSLILSGLLCVYISRSLFSNVLSLLLDPVVPKFAHEMGLFERSEKMGIIRELQQRDMELACDGEGS